MALTTVIAVTLEIIFEGIFYGVYMILFILCLALWRRNNRAVNAQLTLARILLFCLAESMVSQRQLKGTWALQCASDYIRALTLPQADSSSTTKMALTTVNAVTLGIIFEGIFYGLYMVLFILYLVLRRRNNRAVNEPLTLAHILLFCLCTVSLCLDIASEYILIADVGSGSTVDNIETGSTALFSIIDYLAQMILLCISGGGFALVGLDQSPLWSTNKEKLSRLFESIGIMTYSTSLAANALTTSLIVTKILLTSQEVRPVLGSNSHRSLRIAAAVLIKSGLLMFTFQLVFVILFSSLRAPVDLIYSSIPQIYGITPTLLNIRVVMGSAYDETEKTRSLRFAHSRGAAARTGTNVSAAEAESRGINIGLDDAPDNGGAADNV
ncbi:hypothetical protein BD779DRAFT_1682818 [Infundibulicybe gibba]|nr:hypothetical protein BD779DRAFT_1682818 [Infundibulicybe gibba]